MVYFAFNESAGVLDKLDWQTDKFSPVDNLGLTVQTRRPSMVDVSENDVSVGDTSTDLPTNIGASITYSPMVDITVPLTIEKRFEVNLQHSLQDATFFSTPEQMYERAIKPGMTRLVDKINKYMIDKIIANTGNSVDTDGSADGYVGAFLKANQLLTSRGLSTGETRKSMILNPNVLPVLGLGTAKTYYNAPGAGQTFKSGVVGNMAGYDMYETGLLGAESKTAVTLSVTSNPTLPTKWLATGWTVALTVGSGALAIGTKIAFAGVNYVHPSTKVDTGIQATFTVTAYGAGVATLQEVAISTGAFQNVTAAPTTASTVTVLNSGSTAPSIFMFDKAVCAASPVVKLPSTVKGRNINIGGLNVALIEDHWPGTEQAISKLICYVGMSIPRPEAVGTIFNFV